MRSPSALSSESAAVAAQSTRSRAFSHVALHHLSEGRDPVPKAGRHQGQTRSAGSDHALLDPVQTDVGKAQLAFRVGIDAAAFPGHAVRITLQCAYQDSDRDD